MFAGVKVIASFVCFNDAVPEEERQNLTTGADSYPLGIWAPTWASSRLTNAIVNILVTEKMGYNTQVGTGPGTTDQFYAMFGCETPTNLDDRGCGSQETYYHISAEGWTISYHKLWTDLQENYPLTAPENLGSVGYTGVEGEYVQKEILDSAYLKEGLALDYFRGFDARWHNPVEYFHPITAMNLSALDVLPCAETRLSSPGEMEQYVEVTGDLEGVTLNSTSGIYVGRCFYGHFWLPPLCRQNESMCFLHITPAPGYAIEHSMQRATLFHIPMAIAVAKDAAGYAAFPTEFALSFFWWAPDPTFLALNAQRVAFPFYDGEAHQRGDVSSGAPVVTLEKYASYNLQTLAPRVYEFMWNFQISPGVMDSLMLDEVTSRASPTEVACRWLQNNEDVWQKWLPDPTKCFQHFGLHDGSSFVENRDDPTGLHCTACTSGFKSSVLRDGKGITYVCIACALGTFQNEGASLDCKKCPLGEYQDQNASSSCQRCPAGKYQDTEGQSQCKDCPGTMTTLGLGSISEHECVCKADSILTETGVCQSCGSALHCPKGSNIMLLLYPGDEVDNPRLKPGYGSDPATPLKIFLCQGYCPGGAPGNCQGGRVGATCGKCPVGTFTSYTGSCTKCGHGGSGVALFSILMLLGAFVYAFKYALTRGYRPVMETSGVVACTVGMAFSMAQNLAVISAAPTAWPGLLLDTVAALRILTLNIESLGVICPFPDAFGTDQLYLCQALAFPVILCLLLATSSLSKRLSLPQSIKNRLGVDDLQWSWPGTISLMGKFCQVTFPTMSNVGLAPFMCYSHPNGLESLLKHTSIICWSDGHIAMLITGTLLLLFCIAFLAFCFVAAWKGPTWSLQGQTAISFLVDDFRPNLSWFGLVTLSRGVLLSLPPVMAPNLPDLQLILLHSVMLTSLFFQGMFCPFKAPALNVIDATTQVLFLSIICIGLGGLEQTEQGTEVLELFGALLIMQMLMMFALFILIFTIALLLDKMSGSRHGDFGRKCANLGRVPSGKVLFVLFRELVSSMKKCMRSPQRDTIIQALQRLGPHDAHMLLTSFLILQSEVGAAESRNASRATRGSLASNISEVSNISQWSAAQTRIAFAPSALTRRTGINFAMSKMMKSDSEIELDMDEKALGRNSRFSFAIEIQADAEENSYESGEDAGDLTQNGKGYEDQVGSLKNEKDQSLDNDAREQMVSFYA